MAYWIKCTSCKKDFSISQEYKERRLVWLNCPHCQHRMRIEFVGYCPKCNKDVAFRQSFFKDMGESSLEFIKSLPKIANSKGSILFGFGKSMKNAYDGISGNLKMSQGYGMCPYCNQRYQKCPYCGGIQYIDHLPKSYEKFKCTKCWHDFICGFATKK